MCGPANGVSTSVVGDKGDTRTVSRLASSVASALAVLAVAGCSSSADPLVDRLTAAPLPDGAVEVASDERDGDFERGASASVDYSLTAPLAEACPEVLSLYAEAGYTLTDYVDEPDPITDPPAWCATELEPTADGTAVTDVIAIAYPPDEESRYSVDGIVLAFLAGRAGDPNPDGTLLRLTAG